ncbi:hypothetical protein PY650_25920 [Rhizobium calliandrae]|uniref:Uncharacterized protein n=1 Tax=Rhizobium calliandrae TaxID=1312182 RepID=A0ABT7KKC2_9HYPH|nr:hypothetical protein [Rhizobium calliandrae]MDL2409012.1 hypothetical protein [Rhizobium calliandrae]
MDVGAAVAAGKSLEVMTAELNGQKAGEVRSRRQASAIPTISRSRANR